MVSFILSDFFGAIKFSIWGYGTVATPQGALIIGGWSGTYLSTVASYDGSSWKKLNDLHTIRRAHRAIVNGDKVYVVGGQGGQGNGTNRL